MKTRLRDLRGDNDLTQEQAAIIGIFIYMFVKLTQIYMCMILLDEHWRKEVINYEILSEIKRIKRRQRFNTTEYCRGIVC